MKGNKKMTKKTKKTKKMRQVKNDKGERPLSIIIEEMISDDVDNFTKLKKGRKVTL